MSSMSTTPVIPIAAARERSTRVARAMDARRRLADAPAERRSGERASGRVWVNGGELGGARDALAHLAESYD